MMDKVHPVQQQLCDYIRSPDSVAPPQGVELRRLKIYQDLFYKNVEGFISGGFPILRSLIRDDRWHEMVRDFLVTHRCGTPYFLEIGQEFLQYLSENRSMRGWEPPFIYELAHYEWVELALDVSAIDIDALSLDRQGDLMKQSPVVSPLAWSLMYSYRVHHIGQSFQPEQADDAPTFLIVYRDRQDQVEFLESNAVTARLLEILNEDDCGSGRAALMQLASEMNADDVEQLLTFGEQLMNDLWAKDVILGVQPS